MNFYAEKEHIETEILTVLKNIDHLMHMLNGVGMADYLKVDSSWVYKRVCENKIPYVKLGKYNRFRKSAIDRWLELGMVKSVD